MKSNKCTFTSVLSRTWTYVRYALSTLLLLGALGIVMRAIIEKKTQFWASVPAPAVGCLFFLLLLALAVAEGIQIAIVELMKASPELYRTSHPRAYAVAQLSQRKRNVEKFLMGRQVLVVLLVFFLAKITTLKAEKNLPNWVNVLFLESGILGAFAVAVLAQLPSQVYSAKYPIQFLSIPGMSLALYACIFIEWTGLTHVSWLITTLAAMLQRRMSRLLDHLCSSNPTPSPPPSRVALHHDGSGPIDEELTLKTMLLDPERVYSVPFPMAAFALVQCVEAELDTVVADAVYAKHFRRYRIMRIASTNNHNQTSTQSVITPVSPHETFYKCASQIGPIEYASPGEIRAHLEGSNVNVPRFLLPVDDPQHIPPHIVACRLLATVDLLLRTGANRSWKHAEKLSEEV